MSAVMLLLLVAPGLAAQEAARLQATLDSARLQATLDSAREAIEAPGVSAAVIRADGSAWSGVSGIGAPGVPVTTDMVFQLGSVTKTHTAAVLLTLVDAGVLSLDDRLAQWYPDVPHAAEITVRRLLNHTSGLHDPLQEDDYVQLMLGAPAERWTIERLLPRMKEPYHAPGDGWHYTNTGFQLAGRIAEHVTGEPFAALLRRHLLDPLGLGRTGYAAGEEVAPPRSEAFIDVNDDGTPEPVSQFLPMTAFLTSGGTAGAVVASAGDAARWLHALATGAVLSPGMWSAMTTWVDRPDGHQYGLGLLRIIDGVELVGHKGNSAGFSAAVFHAPATGTTVAVLTNAHATDVTPIVRALLSAVSNASSSPSSSSGSPPPRRR